MQKHICMFFLHDYVQFCIIFQKACIFNGIQPKLDLRCDDRLSAIVMTHSNHIEVHTNVEYENKFINLSHTPRVSYAICDSGANSCVVGKIAKVESFTLRTANLAGYDPQTTKTSGLPIVTALLKTMSAENVPMLLQVHEAVYNQNSSITLLSEYQLREYGIVVDSVASKHFTTDGKKGTQALYATSKVNCTLLDRGGLMGIKLYPVEDGDEDEYKVYTITADQLWHLRAFQEGKAYTVQKSTQSYPQCPDQ